MPDLTPITREEMFLDGNTELTPITREEMILAGEDIDVITRREWFLKKYRGSGGEIVLEDITITENGVVTAPSGKAYKKITTDVPLPDNAYLLKEVEGLPSDIVTFNDGANLPMPSLKTTIVPIQSGSGDPSPSNVRPISGWTEANVTVADDTTSPTETHLYTIDLGGTRYGGTLDVVSGVLMVDRAEVNMGDLNWFYTSDAKLFTASIQGIKSGVYTDTNLISSIYPVKPMSYLQFDYGMRYNSATAIGVKNPLYTDAQAFKTAMNGVQLVYELATPLTIQLTPTAIKSLDGVNNVWGDCGQIKEGSYFSKGEEE